MLDIDLWSFTSLVFSVYWGMGREYSTFYYRLAMKIAKKWEYIQKKNWIQTKISFALSKLGLLYLRGSRDLSRNVYFVSDNKKLHTNLENFRKMFNKITKQLKTVTIIYLKIL